MASPTQLLWERPEWRSQAYAWIEQELAKHSLSLNGEPDQFHIRPWSTVMRVPTQNGPVFFKAGATNQAFEPALLEILHRHHSELSLPILGADKERGWMLLPNGGQTLRQVSEGVFSKPAWESLLAQFAQMQIDLVPRFEQMLAVGVPDRRLSKLPLNFEQILSARSLMLIDETGGLSKEEFKILKSMKAELEQLCTELAELDLPPSLDHGDLHDANVFYDGQRFTFFDWGDSSISHPFITLMIPMRVLGNMLGIDDELDPRLNWARDAYLQPWTSYAQLRDLQKAWELALHVGKFQHSLIYFEIMQLLEADEIGEYRDYFPGWLKEFIYHGRTMDD